MYTQIFLLFFFTFFHSLFPLLDSISSYRKRFWNHEIFLNSSLLSHPLSICHLQLEHLHHNPCVWDNKVYCKPFSGCYVAELNLGNLGLFASTSSFRPLVPPPLPLRLPSVLLPFLQLLHLHPSLFLHKLQWTFETENLQYGHQKIEWPSWQLLQVSWVRIPGNFRRTS